MGEALPDSTSPDIFNVKKKNFETFLTRIADDLAIEID